MIELSYLFSQDFVSSLVLVSLAIFFVCYLISLGSGKLGWKRTANAALWISAAAMVVVAVVFVIFILRGLWIQLYYGGLFWTTLGFMLVAAFSVPITKRLTDLDDIYESTWWAKPLEYVAALLIWPFAFFPFGLAMKWAERHQVILHNDDPDIWFKGLIIMACWMIVMGQILHRFSYNAGYREGERAGRFNRSQDNTQAE